MPSLTGTRPISKSCVVTFKLYPESKHQLHWCHPGSTYDPLFPGALQSLPSQSPAESPTYCHLPAPAPPSVPQSSDETVSPPSDHLTTLWRALQWLPLAPRVEAKDLQWPTDLIRFCVLPHPYLLCSLCPFFSSHMGLLVILHTQETYSCFISYSCYSLFKTLPCQKTHVYP